MDELKEGLIDDYNNKLFKDDTLDASKAERLKKLTSHLNKVINRNSTLFAKYPKTYTCKDIDTLSNSDSYQIGSVRPADVIPVLSDYIEKS